MITDARARRRVGYKDVQAKHIPDGVALLAVYLAGRDRPAQWASRSEVEDQLHTYPPKVVLAKMRALLKKGLISGCGCGCRGDFVVL